MGWRDLIRIGSPAPTLAPSGAPNPLEIVIQAADAEKVGYPVTASEDVEAPQLLGPCGTCAYFSSTSRTKDREGRAQDGVCRRYPPMPLQVYVIGSGVQLEYAQARVSVHCQCGEYQQA